MRKTKSMTMMKIMKRQQFVGKYKQNGIFKKKNGEKVFDEKKK